MPCSRVERFTPNTTIFHRFFGMAMPRSFTVGIDFDNTIVMYDELFHRCALEQRLVSPDTAVSKKTIRDQIRALPSGEERWIVLQSIVYGRRMGEARLAEGFVRFLRWARGSGHRICIISHKTQYPAMGERTDLRLSALEWMRCQGFFAPDGFVLDAGRDVFFESTRQDKLRRIASEQCTHFIDDLEEVLFDTDFPCDVARIHYTRSVSPNPSVPSYACWHDILNMFKDLQ